MEEPFLRQNQAGTVEELLAAINAIPDAADSFTLWVPDRVSHRGEVIAQDLAMAIVVDQLLARSFFPDGFESGDKGRLYRYRRER
jgi:hypothetical protein